MGRTKYELRDAHWPAVVIFSGFMLLFLAFSLLLSKWVDRSLITINSGQVPTSPMARLRRTPPEPRLQVSDANDMSALREAENKILNSYGWINAPAGIARIPIERAMSLIAEEGLPARREKNP